MMMLTEGQMSDHKGAFLLFDALPNAKELLGDKGNDSDWFRAALTARGITPCIPPKSGTGDASTHAMIAVRMPSCLPSASPQPSSSGSINETSP
jgi:hypothetical protein